MPFDEKEAKEGEKLFEERKMEDFKFIDLSVKNWEGLSLQT